MPRYMIQETAAPQAVAALMKNPEDRTGPVRSLLQAVGGRLEQYYFSLEEPTVFLIVDMPDQASVYALAMAIFAPGHLSSIRTTPLATASEAADLMKRAASVPYQAPGR